jgi:hypothetical protein
MSYVINNSRGNIVAIVPDGTINTTATSVNLVGRGVTSYGLSENENYVVILENFCNTTAPLLPITGQLWYNNGTDILSAYNSANTWTPIASQDYVQAQKISPAFTGTPTAPTPVDSTNNTQLATTAFVQAQKTNPVFTGTVSTTGNVVAANFVGNVISPAGSEVSTTGNITGGNVLSSGVVSATGNVIGANFIGNVIPPAGGAVSTTGNVTGGNVLTSGIVSATGNIIGSNIIGGNITTNGTVSAVGNITTSNTLIADTVIANTVITTGTSSAFRLPNLTQLQINSLSPQNGDMVYNTTENYPEIYQNGEWKIFTLSFYS